MNDKKLHCNNHTRNIRGLRNIFFRIAALTWWNVPVVGVPWFLLKLSRAYFSIVQEVFPFLFDHFWGLFMRHNVSV